MHNGPEHPSNACMRSLRERLKSVLRWSTPKFGWQRSCAPDHSLGINHIIRRHTSVPNFVAQSLDCLNATDQTMSE